MSDAIRIPAFLLTGFLGSGKTTLLNRLMRMRPPSRGKLAIVVNELGDVGIDGDLLPSGMTRQVELPGGCICCMLNEDLDKTLLDLIATIPELEMIVIETTGVAEPAPITWTFEREPLSEKARVAAVVTVVDAINLEQHRPLSGAVNNQIEYADVLVISKLDLLDPQAAQAQLDTVTEAVRELNETAPIIHGTHEQVAEALWRSLTDPELPTAPPERKRSAIHKEEERSGHDHHHHGANSAPHGFDSVWLPIPGLIDFEELAAQLEELPSNYVRIKGIAYVVDRSTGSSEPHWIAFHRVGTRVSWEPFAGPSVQRMVALGPGIERARLAACLESAVVT